LREGRICGAFVAFSRLIICTALALNISFYRLVWWHNGWHNIKLPFLLVPATFNFFVLWRVGFEAKAAFKRGRVIFLIKSDFDFDHRGIREFKPFLIFGQLDFGDHLNECFRCYYMAG